MTTKRKMLKRVILVIIVSLFLFGTVIGIGIINNRDVSKEQSSKTRLNSDLKTESITEEKEEEDDNEEKLETENKEEQIEEKPKEEMPQSEANTNETYTTPKNDTNTNNQQTTTPTPPVVEEPSCTPKKFYTVFRADFDSMAECNRVGELYKKEYGYYGYFCDYTTDDCGVMYYMLTMFDGNNNYIAYPDIPKP